MIERFEQIEYGIPVIYRHDYQDPDISVKINTYRANSIKALSDFLTNVPGADKFKTFLDVGCGDTFDMKLFATFHKHYTKVMGIDKYLSPETFEKTGIIQGDWYEMAYQREDLFGENHIDVMYMNHSLEHAANVYAVMQQISMLQKKGGVLFISVPEGNSDFGYSITSSTTHFSVLTKGFLSTTLQRFGYNVTVEDRCFREGAPELWAFAIKQYDYFGASI